MKKRKLRESELVKESRYSDMLYELIYEMSPHQLELLCSQAVKILNGEPIDK
jgi:hypothetical protein